MLFTKVRGTRKLRAMLFIQGRFSEGQKREPKSFRERISFFLFRFTALNYEIFIQFRARKP